MTELLNAAATVNDDVVELRRAIHREPELGIHDEVTGEPRRRPVVELHPTLVHGRDDGPGQPPGIDRPPAPRRHRGLQIRRASW